MMDLETALEAHLRRLCVEIGPRPMGTAENHAAADYVRGVFQAAGLDVEEQRLDCPAWKDDGTRLELESETLTAVANVYSPGVDVQAPTVVVGTEAELDAAEMAGRVAVLYGDLTGDPLTTKGCVLYPAERDWRIVGTIEEKRPAAIITVNQRLGSMERIIEDWQFAIPSATVPAEVGRLLVDRPGQAVHLRISTSSAASDSATVIGRRPGSIEGMLVICAHYDTKVDTPGAWDNASGVSALLALATALRDAAPGFGIEFVAFSGEEYGMGLHDQEYVLRSGERFGSIIASINMDGIGHRLRPDTVAIMSHSDAFRSEVDAILKRHPSMIWTDPWPQSNHSTFAWRGIPSIAISSLGHGTGGFAHSPVDSIDWISPARVAEVVRFVAEVARGLDARPVAWTRPV